MNIALILAGGTGSRFGGDIPKQYLEAAGKPVIAYCLKTFAEHEKIDKIQIVADEEWRPFIYECAKAEGAESCGKLHGFSVPGKNRQLSIWNGLKDILEYGGEEDIVIVHDAARPLVSKRIISDCLEACREHDGALTTIPVKDTVYYGRDGKIESLLDRDRLMAGQAPEAFRAGPYYRANERLLPDKILQINGSTEPAVLAGLDIACVAGEERNFKITTREDLARLEQILRGYCVADDFIVN